MRQRCGASQKTTIHRHAPTAQCIAKNHHPSACANGAVHRKNRRRAVLYVSTGLVRLPRDTSGTRNYRRRAVVERCCAEGNRRSAVLYVSTGLARLPRDTYRRRAVVEMPSPHRHRRGATALFRNPVRGAKRMRAGILRILPISRAGGTPLPMAGRLTQLAKIFPVIYTTAFRR